MLIALVIIGLYFWKYFEISPSIDKSLFVDVPAVILAGVTVLFSFVLYLWAPKKHIFFVSLLAYLLLTATTATQIIGTGEILSPFVSLWVLISIFAGVFGLWGFLPILIAVSTFVAIHYINRNFTVELLIISALGSILPLVVGAIIWHGRSAKDDVDSDSKAFRSLANELSEVASKSEVVINAIGDGVVAIDNLGIIQLINPAAQTIIGWGKQDALALSYKSVLKLVNQKDEILDSINDPIQQALNSNQEVRVNNLNLITSSGNKITISLVISPVGTIGSGVITVFHDVTKERAEEREQAEFISTASHEMRTPVASIEGYLGLALNVNTATIDARARDFIMKAHASAEHLGHLFQDLLGVSKSEDGRLSNKPKVTNIVIFVHDIVQGLKQKAVDKGLRLVFRPMPDNTTERYIAPAYFVNLDNDHIREVIDNLVENAIKYTPKGEVMIDITGDEERVIVSVKDSGIGIPAEDMPHLFQKFYRVDDRDTREIGGTGLGLYLSRRLTEMMGGRIWVESVYSRGSTFFVELPRISNHEANHLREQEAEVARQEAERKAEALLTRPPKPPEPIPISAPTPAPIATTQPRTVNNTPPTPIPVSTPATTPISVTQIPTKPLNYVPRGQALTPEQIAAYVVKQRALAQQQAKPQLSRPKFVSIPDRQPRQ